MTRQGEQERWERLCVCVCGAASGFRRRTELPKRQLFAVRHFSLSARIFANEKKKEVSENDWRLMIFSCLEPTGLERSLGTGELGKPNGGKKIV